MTNRSINLNIRGALIERSEICIHRRVANGDSFFERIELGESGTRVQSSLDRRMV